MISEKHDAMLRARRRPVLERLEKWSEPDPNTGCRLWFGHCTPQGYGRITPSDGRRTWLAHRASYEEARGPIPEGLCVCHRCDTPASINPDHLFLGTHLDNGRDKATKGRAPATRGNAKLSASDRAEIKRKRAEGISAVTLSAIYNVHCDTVRQLVSGRTWQL